MSHSTTTIPDRACLANALTCYMQSDVAAITLVNMQALEYQYGAHYNARRCYYHLPLGKLSLFELTLYLPSDTSLADIESVRTATLKAALLWHKTYLSQHGEKKAPSHDVLVFDIQLTDQSDESKPLNKNDQHHRNPKRLKHGFDARYFMEKLIVDTNESIGQLQVFGWHDWHSTLSALQTPCELWRLLTYRLEHLHDAAATQMPSFESEEALVSQFLYSPSLLAPAIVVDNALIKYKVRDEPTPALVAMTLAYRSQSTTAQMYHQHMQQSSALWSQLCSQMIAMFTENLVNGNDKAQSNIELAYWQQQLLDESLFSRHELVRTLYKYPKQEQRLQQNGYVVHQHSYESLGRHYVLIFYGQDADGQNSKKTIQPNLAKIAQDVALRLPIAELHHVIVFGIDFITEADDTFIDIDLWIQPIDTMTQRERQLTKQIQQLKQQAAQNIDEQIDRQTSKTPKNLEKNTQASGLPQVHLSISIPARKDKP